MLSVYRVYRRGVGDGLSKNKVGLCAENAKAVRISHQSQIQEIDLPVKWKEYFTDLMVDSAIGLLVYQKEAVAAWGWLSVASYRRPRNIPTEQFSAVAGWIHSCRTREDYRGQGLYKCVLVELCKWTAEMTRGEGSGGGEWVYIDTERGNAPSNHAIMDLNFDPVAEVLELRVPFPGTEVRKQWVFDAVGVCM